MKQVTSFAVALIVCIALWWVLAVQFTDYIMYDVRALPQARWQVLIFVWSDAPLLLLAAAVGMLVLRTHPLLFGITCGLAATVSVVLCTSEPVLLKSVYIVKLALLLGFAVAGSYFGWWIVGVRNRRDLPLKIWQSFGVLVVMLSAMALWERWHINHVTGKIFKPLVEAARQEPSSEQDGAANGSQPIRSETNSTSSAAASGR